ncbi:MAG: hypothetical protein LBI15_05075 [Dysgonamonadaceae bacterium]|nr:hypothetical protein [Dysgonamonadaceae bacterium]
MDGVAIRAGGDNKLDHLGYGYDATGRFASTYSVKAPVIDMVKYQQMYPQGLDVDKSPVLTGREAVGQTSYTYVTDFVNKLSFDISEQEKKKLFSGNINATYTNKETYSSTYSFASKSVNYVHRRVSMYNTAAEMQKCLSTSFINHVNTTSPENLVQIYGTHVLTRIALGAKIDYLYRSRITTTNKATVVGAGMNASIGKLFKTNSNSTLSTTLDTRNQEQSLHYEIVGGKINLAPVGNINVQVDNGVRDLTHWERSIDTTNMVFVDILDYGLIPIYDLIADPLKKTRVKEAVEKYILSKQLEEERLPNAIYAGERILAGNPIYSPNRRYILTVNVFGGVGALKSGSNYDMKWNVGMPLPTNRKASQAELTHNGEFKIMSPTGATLFSSNTNIGPKAKLVLDDFGNLTLYDQAEQRKWVIYLNGTTARF